MITGAPINGNKMGTITFILNNSTLGTNQIHTLKNIKLFPNPSNGKITISNIQNIDLKTIEIYNVLGRLAKQIPVSKNESKLIFDFTHLNSGVYLLKLYANNGNNKTQKLIIK